MTFSGYHSLDLIQTKDGRFKIIDWHGLSDAVSFTEKAGYNPRNERVYRYFELLKKYSNGKPILYLFDLKTENNYILPKELESFYSSLPEGFANLEWSNIMKERDSNEKNRNPKVRNLFLKELDLFEKAARMNDVGFIPAILKSYEPDMVSVNRLQLENDSIKDENIYLKDMGLIMVWGHDFKIHPDFGYYWSSEKKEIRIPVLNKLPLTYALSPVVPKWTPRLLIDTYSQKINTDEIFPKEIYYGMGLSTSENIREFSESLEEPENGIMAVLKPLCCHMGVDVGYLDESDLYELIKSQSELDIYINQVRSKTFEMMFNGIHYTTEDGDNRAMRWPWRLDHSRIIYPIAEYGSYILQQYLDAKPIRSKKTSKMHQGTIRVQMLNGKLISAMHRFPEEEYNHTIFTPLTEKSNKTFFERADDSLEVEIYEFLEPVLSEFEDIVNSLKLHDIARLSMEKVLDCYDIK